MASLCKTCQPECKFQLRAYFSVARCVRHEGAAVPHTRYHRRSSGRVHKFIVRVSRLARPRVDEDQTDTAFHSCGLADYLLSLRDVSRRAEGCVTYGQNERGTRQGMWSTECLWIWYGQTTQSW